MYLKSIKAYGFKSFADKINIELNNNITAIVGPNGSGKSNIVDAVKWVLGEQSVKSLRGTSMTDVIFTGSKSRDAYNRAMVTLTFDNNDEFLKSDFKEIEIKRVVYSSGENEYYINNTKVRLKDITELFLDSGIGNDSLNIISQRKIEQIVDSKPIEKRVIFEEAAEVLKYKKRKEESLRKLDRTADNLFKLNLVIEELKITVEPLKEQSEKARLYKDFKDDLKNIEISLIASDITAINEEYIKSKDKVKEIEDKNNELDNEIKKNNLELESKKVEILKIENEINDKNNKHLEIVESLAKINSEKQILIDKQKSASNDNTENIIVNLTEEIFNYEKNIAILNKEIEDLTTSVNTLENQLSDLSEKESMMKIKNTSLNNKIKEMTRDNYNLISKKEVLENIIENNSRVPSSVRNILNNTRLNGVHNTIGNLIKTDEKYVNAIDIAIGSSSNFVVVDNEKIAKKCIEFLKENKIGRATFFPLNVIKEKYVDMATRNRIREFDFVYGTADELVKYDEKYNNIIKNQLGNIIVVDNIDNANKIGKLIDYRFRVITLDGDIIHSGGSMSGGSLKNSNSVLKDQKELEKIKNELNFLSNELEKNINKANQTNKELEELIIEEDKINRLLINKKEVLNSKKNIFLQNQEIILTKKSELDRNTDFKNNKIDDKLNEILNQNKNISSEKEILLIEIDNLKNTKQELNEDINILQNKIKKITSVYNSSLNILRDNEVSLGKMDMKLDNLLLNLTENYNLTYEKAKMDYSLEINEDVARERVSYLKREMNKLGEVNLGAISEYERLNTRYEFLLSQKEDLENASQNLTSVISEMDEIMKEKFVETFNKISKEFSEVFKKMFKGGNGKLILTNPEDVLNSGVDIIAEPPGKKLKSNSFLSGGEKTLTAISLLFAILNVKPVPFCILDEVEAALDESNVDLFGKYLKEKENKSQFILITHKKRTMEYADTLYGITMQESGVSKIVSVNLSDN